MLSKQYNLLLKFEPPTKEENAEWLGEIKDSRDKEIAWKFVLLNARFVANVLAHSFPNTSMTDEMFSDGILGFFNAVMRVQNTDTFFGYADEYIHGYALRGFQKRHGRKRYLENKIEKIDEGPLSYDYIFQEDSSIYHKPLKQFCDNTECFPDEIVVANDNKIEAKAIIRKIIAKSGLSRKEKELINSFIKCQTFEAGVEVVAQLGLTRQALWVRRSTMLRKIHGFIRRNKNIRNRLKELLEK